MDTTADYVVKRLRADGHIDSAATGVPVESTAGFYAAEAVAQTLAALRTEIERLRADTKTLREAVVSAAHTLEQARIWDGMKWHWNINANACERAWKILDAALAAKEE